MDVEGSRMTGGEALLRTLCEGGADLYLANPGTSEMHLVEALDRVHGIRPVLGLFEGVLSGAADGYARMTGRPAITLFHLGPGLANGLANLHNPRRAMVPMVNLVGEHTAAHLPKDPPLASDIESLARPMSHWVRRNNSAATLAEDGAAALAAALSPPGRIATLIVPADSAWQSVQGPLPKAKPPAAPAVPKERVREIANVLRRNEPAALLAGTSALRDPGLRTAGRIAAKAGTRLLCGTFPARISRGVGRPRVERIPYFPERAAEFLAGLRHIVLVGDRMTVPFFGYPTISSEIVPAGCELHTLAAVEDDVPGALEALAAELGAEQTEPSIERSARPQIEDGAITPEAVARVLGALLPEGAIVSDEGATSSLGTLPATAGAPPHDWLFLTGGAIGQGVPVATGAALACPDRKVITLEGDGSGMYTIQALWTQAREKLDVTTIVFANRSYAILGMELSRMANAMPSDRTRGLIDLGNPEVDWVSLARGLGVEGERVTSLRDLEQKLASALRERGPRLLEVPISARPR
jgi:acetolactate synthase-1/2/3 large subunit